MSDIGYVEYRVVPVTRYIVTRYHADTNGDGRGSEKRGEYDNEAIAYEVGYALAREEHDRLGWKLGDIRMKYPEAPRKREGYVDR